MSVLDGPGEGTWSVFAQKVVEERDRAIEERDEALRLLATRVEAKRLDEAQEEIAALRALVFAAVDDYAHGRLLLFELCDRIGAPYPSDKKVVSLAARVKEIEAENAALRAEVAALRLAADEVLSWSLNDTTALLTNPPQNAALFHAQRVLRKAMGD